MQSNLKLYSSLSKRTDLFKPLKDQEVSMYVCGITPYDTTHLGHAFTYMSFDALNRYLKFLGYKINYTQNVTDIDDDLLKRAAKENRNWQELGKFWTDRFTQDLKTLNIEMPTNYVRATDSIPTIIKIVSTLIEKELAYEVDGTVYFEVKKFANYGNLSGFDRNQMIELSRERGANPEDTNKRDPLDFIMWQRKQTGEPSWSSPWGEGRPGWHIECSAMIHDTLGEQIDIHGGGHDLIFPHHESEIAQSESFTGKDPFVKTWMHIGMVFYKSEKMAKSLGNMVMVRDLLKKYSANAIRFLLLSHHYRMVWEYEELEMEEASKNMANLEEIAKNGSNEPFDKEFIDALNNDFNTPDALKFLVFKKPKSLKSSLQLLGFKV